MKILVCGGRDYTDRESVFRALDAVHARKTITCIIHGAARGADSLAGEWERERGVEELRFPADWNTHGKKAGPIRNQQMLDQARPDGVIAFPGRVGTADMVSRAEDAGVMVWIPIWR